MYQIASAAYQRRINSVSDQDCPSGPGFTTHTTNRLPRFLDGVASRLTRHDHNEGSCRGQCGAAHAGGAEPFGCPFAFPGQGGQGGQGGQQPLDAPQSQPCTQPLEEPLQQALEKWFEKLDCQQASEKWFENLDCTSRRSRKCDEVLE